MLICLVSHQTTPGHPAPRTQHTTAHSLHCTGHTIATAHNTEYCTTHTIATELHTARLGPLTEFAVHTAHPVLGVTTPREAYFHTEAYSHTTAIEGNQTTKLSPSFGTSVEFRVATSYCKNSAVYPHCYCRSYCTAQRGHVCPYTVLRGSMRLALSQRWENLRREQGKVYL